MVTIEDKPKHTFRRNAFYNQETPMNERCVICGPSQVRPFLETTDQKTRNLSHSLWLVQCRRCNLVFLAPRPSPLIAEEYFLRAYNSDSPYYADDGYINEKCGRRLSWLGPPSSEANRLLDVGAGSGYFTFNATRSGWAADGIEIDPKAREMAKVKFGLSLYPGPLGNTPFAQNSVDVITMWDLIEHVENPRETLAKAHRILADGGRVVITTANIESWDFESSPKTWDMLFSGHLFYFSPSTLRRLLTSTGFSDITISDSREVDRPPTPVYAGTYGLESLTLTSALQAFLKRPARLLKIPAAIRRKVQFAIFRLRHPYHYDIPIMLASARKQRF
jgi:2-polyprenyl-3-methyl-5-hydroxy-6-metoxy-1,4-benzoquinol methylase